MLPRVSETATFNVGEVKKELPVSKSFIFLASHQASSASNSRVPLKPTHCKLTPAPDAGSNETRGPLLRRGTTRTAGGTPLPGGTGTIAPAWLAKNCSGIATIGSLLPLKIVLNPLGEFGSATIAS